MPSIGDTLREARMRQKLDIADVEDRTKIRAKYLRALENEEFGLLPGSTFVKTFLRTYAEVLGLDPHLLVEEYRANYEAEEEPDIQPLGPPAGGRRERERRVPRPGPPGRGWVVGGIVVALLGFLLVLGLVGGSSDNGGKGSGTKATETTKKRALARRKRRRAPALATAVTVKIAPTDPTYVCLDKGAGTPVVFEGILQQPRTFKGKKLRLNLGKTSAAVSANGKPVQIQQSPNPVGFEFSPTGSKPLPVGQRPCA